MVQILWSWWVLAVLVSLGSQHTAVSDDDLVDRFDELLVADDDLEENTILTEDEDIIDEDNFDELLGNGPLIPLSKGNIVEHSGPNRTGPWFVIYDFVNAYTVNQVMIINYDDTTHDVESFKLESSNDYKTWTLVATIDNVEPGTSEPQFFTIYGEGQFWKLTIEEVPSDFLPWFSFFSFFGEISLEFGKQFNGPSPLIVGGNNARKHTWRWMVSLMQRETRKCKTHGHCLKHFCGGSLITELHVLTAAHCFDDQDYRHVVVLLGEYNLKREEGNEEYFRISKPHIHPNFPHRLKGNDIAILKLNRPTIFNSAIYPVILPGPGTQDFTGMNATAIGWGDTDGSLQIDKWEHILQEVMVPIWSQNSCNQLVICAGSFGRDTCKLDSGGPLLIVLNNYWTVIGIVSRGPQECGSGKRPGVYTRVDQFLGWICGKITESRYLSIINACK